MTTIPNIFVVPKSISGVWQKVTLVIQICSIVVLCYQSGLYTRPYDVIWLLPPFVSSSAFQFSQTTGSFLFIPITKTFLYGLTSLFLTDPLELSSRYLSTIRVGLSHGLVIITCS